MPEAPDTIDDAVAGLSSPTTEEVLDDVGVRGFPARDLAAWAIANGGGGGGGGLERLTQTATVTTDPDTFITSHEFDLGGLTIVLWRMTLVSLDLDGEPLGAGGGIGVSTAAENEGVADSGVSLDAVAWQAGINLFSPIFDITDSFMLDADQFQMYGFATPRYLGVGVGIYDVDAFEIYAGANHPTAEVRLDLEYFG